MPPPSCFLSRLLEQGVIELFRARYTGCFLMIDKHTALFKILDKVADSVIPLLAIVLIVLLIRATASRQIDWRRWAAALLGIAAVYVVSKIDRSGRIWLSFHSDYSTHSALTAAIMVPLAYLRPAWKAVLAGIFVAYAALMMALSFHTVLDIISTLVVILPVVVLIHFALLGKTATLRDTSVTS